jgi:4-hydroxybenzoate polyprenyltransferase
MSTAIILAEKTRPFLLICTLGAGVLWSVAGIQAGLAWPYFAACGVAITHMGWQVVSADYGERASLASRFNSNKWVGAALLIGIVAGRLASSSAT